MGEYKMRKVLFILLAASSLTLASCDVREDKNIEVYSENYINTSETVKINGYNGYKLISSEIIQNDDGSYNISIKMDKPLK